MWPAISPNMQCNIRRDIAWNYVDAIAKYANTSPPETSNVVTIGTNSVSHDRNSDHVVFYSHIYDDIYYTIIIKHATNVEM